jgi:transposase
LIRKPEVIPDEEHVQVHQRVCGIDVAKETGMVCVRTPDEARPGRRVNKVWQVKATTRSVIELGETLLAMGVEMVTMESTSDYWRIFFYLLEVCGLDVQLVNARDVKNVPGRPKTDKLDAVWLARLTEWGLLRPSFIPPAPIRVLRDYTRTRVDLTRDRTRHWQRLEKLLEDALIKVSSVASTLTTMSTRDMVEALIAGERDPQALAGLARGKMKSKYAALVEALTGQFDDHHAELAKILLTQIDALTADIDKLSARIDELVAAIPAAPAPLPATGPEGPGTPPGPGHGPGHADTADLPGHADTADLPATLSALERLDEIPGIASGTAEVILAEVGLDMSRFPTPDHLVSWARVSPRTIQSGPRVKGGKTGKGNPYLKGALGSAAAAAARTDTFLGDRYRRLVKRRGKGKALVAVSRSILIIVWHLLNDPATRFHELGADYHLNREDKKRKMRHHINQLEALGLTVTVTPRATVTPAAA